MSQNQNFIGDKNKNRHSPQNKTRQRPVEKDKNKVQDSCWTCGKQGHISRFCPNQVTKRNVNNVPKAKSKERWQKSKDRWTDDYRGRSKSKVSKADVDTFRTYVNNIFSQNKNVDPIKPTLKPRSITPKRMNVIDTIKEQGDDDEERQMVMRAFTKFHDQLDDKIHKALSPTNVKFNAQGQHPYKPKNIANFNAQKAKPNAQSQNKQNWKLKKAAKFNPQRAKSTKIGYIKTTYDFKVAPTYLGQDPVPYSVPTQVKLDTACIWHNYPQDVELNLPFDKDVVDQPCSQDSITGYLRAEDKYIQYVQLDPKMSACAWLPLAAKLSGLEAAINQAKYSFQDRTKDLDMKKYIDDQRVLTSGVYTQVKGILDNTANKYQCTDKLDTCMCNLHLAARLLEGINTETAMTQADAEELYQIFQINLLSPTNREYKAQQVNCAFVKNQVSLAWHCVIILGVGSQLEEPIRLWGLEEPKASIFVSKTGIAQTYFDYTFGDLPAQVDTLSIKDGESIYQAGQKEIKGHTQLVLTRFEEHMQKNTENVSSEEEVKLGGWSDDDQDAKIQKKKEQKGPEKILDPNLTDYNCLTSYYEKMSRSSPQMISFKPKANAWLVMVNPKHENYENTCNEIRVRIQAMKTLSTPRTLHNRQTILAKHVVRFKKESDAEQVGQDLFKSNWNTSTKSLILQLWGNGSLPLSGLQNTPHFHMKLAPYEHGLARTVNDTLVIEALMKELQNLDPNEKIVVADIGSKWDKTVEMFRQLGFYNIHLIAVKPSLLNVDVTFIDKKLNQAQRHALQTDKQIQFSDHQDERVTIEVVDIVLADNIDTISRTYQNDQIDIVLANDVHYYKGVQEFLQVFNCRRNGTKYVPNTHNLKTPILCVSNAYPQTESQHQGYYWEQQDKIEGAYKVKVEKGIQMVSVAMNGNYTPYVHPNLPFNGHSPMSVDFTICKTTRTLQIHKAIKIGEGVSTVFYTISPYLPTPTTDVSQTRVKIYNQLVTYFTQNGSTLENDRPHACLNAAANLSRQNDLSIDTIYMYFEMVWDEAFAYVFKKRDIFDVSYFKAQLQAHRLLRKMKAIKEVKDVDKYAPRCEPHWKQQLVHMLWFIINLIVLHGALHATQDHSATNKFAHDYLLPFIMFIYLIYFMQATYLIQLYCTDEAKKNRFKFYADCIGCARKGPVVDELISLRDRKKDYKVEEQITVIEITMRVLKPIYRFIKSLFQKKPTQVADYYRLNKVQIDEDDTRDDTREPFPGQQVPLTGSGGNTGDQRISQILDEVNTEEFHTAIEIPEGWYTELNEEEEKEDPVLEGAQESIIENNFSIPSDAMRVINEVFQEFPPLENNIQNPISDNVDLRRPILGDSGDNIIFDQLQQDDQPQRVGGTFGYRTLDPEGIFRPYDPDKLKQKPNGNVRGLKCYDFNGREVPPEDLYKVAEQVDNQVERKNRDIFNPGLDMTVAGITLSFADMRKPNLLKAQTLFSRVLGNENAPCPLKKKEYIKEVRKLMPEIKKEFELAAYEITPLDYEQYIDQLKNTGQKKRYKRILARYRKGDNMCNAMVAELKKYESQYTKSVRGRIIHSPPESVVLHLGVLNHYYLKVLKKIFPNFVSGLNLDQTGDIIRDAVKGFKDPVFICTDDSQYDSTQWDWLFKEIDIELLKILIPLWGHRLGLDEALIMTMERLLLKTTFKFVMYYEGTRKIMVEGTLLGMTLSGISTQTTGGNTLREIIKQRVFNNFARTPSKQWISFHAGDDTVVIIERHRVPEYLKVVSKMMGPEQNPIPHGIGGQIKELLISDVFIQFLSKDIIMVPEQALASRQAARVYQGGQVTTKLSEQCTPENFNFGQTRQLEAGHRHHPLFKAYIEHRQKNLPSKEGGQMPFDFKHAHELGKNRYDTKDIAALYDQFLPWLETSEYNNFRWDEGFVREVLPKLQYKVPDIGFSNKIVRDYGPIREDKHQRRIGGAVKLNIPQIQKLQQEQQNEKAMDSNSNIQRNRKWQAGANRKMNPGQIKSIIERGLQLYANDNRIPQLEKNMLEIKKTLDSQIGDKKVEDLVKMVNDKNQFVIDALDKMRREVNPFYDIPTSAIKQVDPNFTWADRKAMEEDGFQAMRNINAFNADGVIKDGQVMDQAAYMTNPKASGYSKATVKLQDLYDNMSVPYDMQKNQLRMLMALDGWEHVAPLVYKYGRPMVQHLYNMARPHIQAKATGMGLGKHFQTAEKLFKQIAETYGGDEGYNPIDHVPGTYAFSPYKYAQETGLNSFNLDQTSQNVFSQHSKDFTGRLIDIASLASYIAPEEYSARTRIPNPKAVAISRQVNQTTLTTNASGNLAIRIHPGANTIVQIGNGAGFSPEAGTNGGGWTGVLDRPLGSQTGISNIRVASLAVSLKFSTSSDQNGNVQMSYMRQEYNSGLNALDTYAIPRRTISNGQFYQTGNSYSPYRFKFPYNELTDVFIKRGESAFSSAVEQPVCYILLTGFPASTIIGYLEMATVLEFIPKENTGDVFDAQVVERECPGTKDFLEGLFVNYKQLATLTLSDARIICQDALALGPMAQAEQINHQIHQSLQQITSGAKRIGGLTQLQVAPKSSDIQLETVTILYLGDEVFIVAQNPTPIYENYVKQYPDDKRKIWVISFGDLTTLNEEDFTWNSQFDKDALIVKLKGLYGKYAKLCKPYEAEVLTALIAIGLNYLITGQLIISFNGKEAD